MNIKYINDMLNDLIIKYINDMLNDLIIKYRMSR
jgi:hypothetical protein